MDVFYVDDDGTYDDLDDYSKGSFIYGGEIYMRLKASDDEILAGLNKLHENHPEPEVKLKAVHSAIIFLIKKIEKKHC